MEGPTSRDAAAFPDRAAVRLACLHADFRAAAARAGGPGAGPWPVAALRMEYAPGVAEFASPDSVMAQTFRLLPMWAVAKLPEAYEVEHSLPAG
jgi:hypothetical protein